MMKMKPLYLSCATALLFGQMAYADTTNDRQASLVPANKPTVVLDTLMARFVLPTHVQVLGQKHLKETAAQNIDDMVMYEAGVDVASDNMRLGHQNFVIRGISGNRILTTVDGIPLPDEQRDIGRFSTVAVSSRDTIEADTVKNIRIVKGGNGTAQGDGTVGGSVNMQTFKPSDFVDDDKPTHLGLKYGYRSAYQSHGATLTAAGKYDIYSALLMLTKRKSHQVKNYPAADATELGERRTESNHQDTDQSNALLKLHVNHDNHHLETAIEYMTRQTDTELYDKQGNTSSRSGGLLERPAANAMDKYVRSRYSAAYRFVPDSDIFDEFSLSVYKQGLDFNDHHYSHQIAKPNPNLSANTQGTRPTQAGQGAGQPAQGTPPQSGSQAPTTQGAATNTSPSAQGRPTATQAGQGAGQGRPAATQSTQPREQIIDEKNTYNQHIVGVRPELSKTLTIGGIQHRLLVGGEYRNTKTSRLRFQDVEINGKLANNTGAYFPPADRHVVSAYLQDNIAFVNGSNLGLGLRYEKENTTFDFDHASYVTNTSGIPEKFDNFSNGILLPSLGYSYPIADNLTASFAYRRGYRSPDVNFIGAGYNNPKYGYRIIPNPKLKPESSDNYEVGLRFNDDGVNASVTTFYNRYKDFISNYTPVAGSLPKGYTSQYHFDNLDNVRTYGLEGKLNYQVNDNLKASGSFAWIDGKNTTNGEPLANLYPLNGVLALDYEQERWEIGAKLRMAEKKRKVPNPYHDDRGGITPYFKTPSYAVLDLVASFRPTDSISLGAGVYNVTDKKYWTAGDTAGVLDNVQKDRHTQTGRNFAFNAEFKF